jgi:hypothetical protein
VKNGRAVTQIRFERHDSFHLSAAVNGECLVAGEWHLSDLEVFRKVEKVLNKCEPSAVFQYEMPEEVITGFCVEIFPFEAGDHCSYIIREMVQYLEHAMREAAPRQPVWLKGCDRKFDTVTNASGSIGTLLDIPFAERGFCCERRDGKPIFNIRQLVYGEPNSPAMDWLSGNSALYTLASNILYAYTNCSGVSFLREQSHRLCVQFCEIILEKITKDGGEISLSAIDEFLLRNSDC